MHKDQKTAPAYQYLLKSNFSWLLCLGGICLHSSAYLWHMVKLGEDMDLLQARMRQINLTMNISPNCPIKGAPSTASPLGARSAGLGLRKPMLPGRHFSFPTNPPFQGTSSPLPLSAPHSAHSIRNSCMRWVAGRNQHVHRRKSKEKLNT